MNRTTVFVIFASLALILLGFWFLLLYLRISPLLRRIVLALQTALSFAAIYFVCRFLEFNVSFKHLVLRFVLQSIFYK